MLMKNSNDTIGNRTRVLPACTEVPQPTAPSRRTAPGNFVSLIKEICKKFEIACVSKEQIRFSRYMDYLKVPLLQTLRMSHLRESMRTTRLPDD